VATQTRPADRHQAGQEALVSLVPALVARAWSLLDPHDIQGTLPRFLQAIMAIVDRYGAASAVSALDHYRQTRSAMSRFVPKLAGRTPPDLVEGAVKNSLAPLYGVVTPADEAAARAAVAEATAQMVLERGRRTIIDNAYADPAAKGWVRVTEPEACAFCLMLALRGPIYLSSRSATFRSHPHCRCHAEPIFTAYEPPYRMIEAQRLWDEAKKSDLRTTLAFRQLVEGRYRPEA
jgi:hypothetical protein